MNVICLSITPNGGNKKRGNCTMFQVITAASCHVFYYVLCTGDLLTTTADYMHGNFIVFV